MNEYFAYIRVSTVKQGERGTSLDEQRSAIDAYARRDGLAISVWFEEMETAAKQGRRQFSRMLAELRKGNAKGVIIHKIDRSARNLKDWAQIGDLIDAGVDIRFAHESLDLTSRGGRLSADIQAVVAADFIRNHRQVVRAGFEGRLKQGLYPLPAPRGYLDRGKGKPKLIDPAIGRLVRTAFELYASGSHTFDTLREEMFTRGLRGKTGKPLSLDAVSVMLRNSFYIGLIRIERSGQTFEGVHEALVPKATFDRVQAIISGRVFARPQKHAHTYRRMIRCAACGYALSGEVKKGRTYYRCHTRTCRGTSLRECDIDQAIRERLAAFVFTEEEFRDIRDLAREIQAEEAQVREDRLGTLSRDLAKCEERLTRLTDALLDGLIDKETFEARKSLLVAERISLRARLEGPEDTEPFGERVLKNLERANAAYLGYDFALPEEKREMVRELTSNLAARGKTLDITMRDEFRAFLEWRSTT
jgi:DNA invertase Pin-like site-specific DNA recombinase